jgi:intein/homing endonuclease
MEVLGLIVSEGYVHDDGVTFANNDAALRDHYKSLLYALFDTDKTTEYSDGRVVVYSKTLVAYLEQFGLRPGRKVPTVPPQLYRCPPEEAAAFVRGYFDGDGTVAMQGKYPTPKLYSSSKAFLHEMQGLLQLKLGVGSAVRRHPTPLGEMHALVVRGNQGRVDFANKIGAVSRRSRQAGGST